MPVPPSPNLSDAHRVLQELLQDPDSLSFTFHSRMQSTSRSFDRRDIRHALASGVLSAEEWDDKHKNWKYRVVGRDLDGDRLAVIIVLDQNHAAIKIITAF